MSDKKNKTFIISESVHRDFKMECAYQGGEMSNTLESFMISYVKLSRKQRIEANEQ